MNLRSKVSKSLLSNSVTSVNDPETQRQLLWTRLEGRPEIGESQEGVSGTPSDSWALKELAEHIKGAGEPETRPQERLTGYRAVLVTSLDKAMEIVGRSGREVIYGLMERRYGLRAEDIVTKPGVYVSGLRDLLGSSCIVVEKHVLAEIRQTEGIDAYTIEDAVFKLKKKYGDL